MKLVVQTVYAKDKQQDYYRPFAHAKECAQETVEPTQTDGFEQTGDEARSDIKRQSNSQEYQSISHYRADRFRPLKLLYEPQREPCTPKAGSHKAKDECDDGCEFHYHPPHQPSNKADEKG